MREPEPGKLTIAAFHKAQEDRERARVERRAAINEACRDAMLVIRYGRNRKPRRTFMQRFDRFFFG